MHIPGGSFIFNISCGRSPSVRHFHPQLRPLGCCESATRSGTALSCVCLAHHGTVDAADRTNTMQRSAHAPISVFDLRF